MPVTPLADTFLPRFTLLATLVTALKARLALFIVPFLPYDVLLRTAVIPAFTARLNLLVVFLRTFLPICWPATAACASGIGYGCNICAI